MSAGLDGGGRGGREFFLSSHRCPEVDLLPHHNSKTQIPAPWSLRPADRSSEFTSTGQPEANYLDVTSSCRSKKEEEEQEEEEGSTSDWSEEDLCLHFSPSVILPSDDEESDPESSLECIDVTMETQEKGQKGEGPKMVPKRLIQLKKKTETETMTDQEKSEKQAILKDGPAARGVANSDVSANELLCRPIHRCPDLLLRQHSMPASLHTRSTTTSDVDSYRVYRGLVTGASQAPKVGDILGNAAPRQRLQRSFSLDDTKTKMASCIISSVLSKKMQVEQNTCKTSYPQKKAALLPAPPQRVREGAGVFRAPVHVVRDVRSLVKNTYSLPFSSTTLDNNKPASFKVIGQDESPPPTYQQVVCHDETKQCCPASSRGFVTKVAASLSQSEDRQQSVSHPMTQQRRGSEPIQSQVDDVTRSVMLLDPPTSLPVRSNLSEVSQSERGRDVSHLAGTSHQPPVSAKEQSPILGVSSQSASSSSQQILHPCFYTPTALPAFPPTLHPHLGQVSYLHSPLSYIQTQLQPPRPIPIFHWLPGNTSDQLDHVIRTSLPLWTRNAGDQESSGNTVTPATQQQYEQLQQQHEQLQQQHEQLQQQHEQQRLQQQQFLCSVQGFLPAQVGNDFVTDITGAAAAPGAVLSCPAPNGPAPCHMILDPKSGRYFYVGTPPPPQRKLLLDPETGQFIKVFLPAARSAPNAGGLPVRCTNPAPTAINPAPAVLSVMPLQPMVGVPSPYAAPCLPFTLHTPAANM